MYLYSLQCFRKYAKNCRAAIENRSGTTENIFWNFTFCVERKKEKRWKIYDCISCIVEFYIDFQAIQTDDVFRNRNCFIFLGAKIKSNIDYESALYGSFQKLKRNYISIFLCSSSNPAYLSGPG